MDLLTITSLALVDAINPCTLAVQLLLISTLLGTKGRKSALIGGILFSVTIFVMYFLYGIGLLTFLYAFGIDWVIKVVLKSLLAILAVLEILAYFRYKPGALSVEMPMKLRPLAKKLLSSVENPLVAIPAAALCSVLLLPCSSGPYAAALLTLRTLSSFVAIPLMLYYNSIFILPMIGITIAVYFGTQPKTVMKWREKHIRELHLVSGLLLVIVFVMV